MDFKTNERLDLAFNYLFYTGRNVFLTGKAGTGKTTFLKRLKQICPKRMIVTSPTGVAAINAGGVTLHSFFQLPLGPQIPGSYSEPDRRFSKVKIDIIRSLQLLVIDEISMVRADLLDSVDTVLKRYRGNKLPFGGVQLLLIGDMQQLSPVVRPEDEEILRPYYDTYYFFGSKAWQKTPYVCIELNQIFRQTDTSYIDILNAIRNGRSDSNILTKLNTRYIPNYTPDKDDDVVTLVTTNAQAERINSVHMLELDTEKRTFNAEITGDFPESSFPVDRNLMFKVGSVVMFLKNDTGNERRFYNGKIGRIVGFDTDSVVVKCKGDSENITVKPMRWENTKYTVDSKTKEITEEVVGTFTQIPLKTAWAVTIHKSQGLTFDNLLLDAHNSFAHGQVYVALSRCRTLEGLILLQPLRPSDIITDPAINTFAESVEQNTPDEGALTNDRRAYFFNLVAEMFDFSQLHASVQSLQRAVAEAGSSFVGNNAVLEGIDSKIYADMMTVAEKFTAVINPKYANSPDPEQETELTDRISKGCVYFKQKIDEYLNPIAESFSFDCDDKTKAKRIRDHYEEFAKMFKIKNGCILSLQDGFSIKKYLETKAKLSMTDEAMSSHSRGSSQGASSSDSQNPELYQMLSKWRKQAADDAGVEPKEIVSTKTILSISNKVPSEYKELVEIKGMGGSKGKAFAKAIFDIVMAYRRKKGLPINELAFERAAYESMSSEEKTLALFEEGCSVAEIAQKRGLAQSTVFGHVERFVASGQLPAKAVIDEKCYEEICMFIAENPKLKGLGEIRAGLEEKYSWDEIRIALAGFRSEN